MPRFNFNCLSGCFLSVFLITAPAARALPGPADYEIARQNAMIVVQRTSVLDLLVPAKEQIQSDAVTISEQKWFLSHLSELIEDIRLSPHQWFSGPSSVCGETEGQPFNAIRLYHSGCPEQPFLAQQELVYSSLLHLGLALERARYIATQIYRIKPNWDNASRVAQVTAILESALSSAAQKDPFDPTSCPGPALDEKDLHSLVGPIGAWQPKDPDLHFRRFEGFLNLGRFVNKTRVRACYSGIGCGLWTEQALPPSLDPMGLAVLKVYHIDGISWNDSLHTSSPPKMDDLEITFGRRVNLQMRQGSFSNPVVQRISDSCSLPENYINPHYPSNGPHCPPYTATITASCVRLFSSTEKAGVDNKGNNVTFQYESVIYAAY